MKRKLVILIVFGFMFSSCQKQEACSAGSPNIVGAQCNDGSSSSATGSGACSHHGGVDYWKCQD